jgi:hypothetical protein
MSMDMRLRAKICFLSSKRFILFVVAGLQLTIKKSTIIGGVPICRIYDSA